MRVLICGGRNFVDMRAMSREMAKVRDWYGGISCVIEGGARGADGLGRLWAEREGIPVLEVPANWDLYGSRAGPIRNGWMIEHAKPDVVVAFPGGRGTENMLAQAAKAELLIWTPLAIADGTATAAANGDLPVPQDCQARAVRHRPGTPSLQTPQGGDS